MVENPVSFLEYVNIIRTTDEFAIDTAIGNINVQTGERVRNFPLPGAEVFLIFLGISVNTKQLK